MSKRPERGARHAAPRVSYPPIDAPFSLTDIPQQDRDATPPGHDRYFARTTRGLEWITTAEIEVRLEGAVTEICHRLVRFNAPRDGRSVATLSTADDVFEELVAGSGVGSTLNALKSIASIVDAIPPADRLLMSGAFEVVASFIGKRNYSRFDLEDRLGAALSRRFGGTYRSRRQGPASGPTAASWRAHLWDDRLVLGLRVADRPLHRRSYRQLTVPGALHPPIASAMSLLAGVAPRDRVFDPCCGSGTLLIEAGGLSPLGAIVGMDINRDHVEITLRNAGNAGLPLIGLTGDAANVPMADGCVDVCLANPPWGRQINASGQLALDQSAFWRELQRLLSNQGRASVLLDNSMEPPNWAGFGLNLRQELPLAISGRWATVYLLTAGEAETVGGHPRSVP